jgi:hypothetical protein
MQQFYSSLATAVHVSFCPTSSCTRVRQQFSPSTPAMLLLAVSHDAMLLDYLSQDSLWVFDGPPPANILELWEDDDSKGDELWPQQIKAPADQGHAGQGPTHAQGGEWELQELPILSGTMDALQRLC